MHLFWPSKNSLHSEEVPTWYAAARRALRHRELDRPVDGRHRDARAEHRLVDGDGEFQMDFVAEAGELGVRADRDLDQGVALGRPRRARVALALEPDRLALLDPGRYADVEGLAGRQADPPRGAQRRVEKIDGDLELSILAAGRPRLGRPPAPAEELANGVFGPAAAEVEAKAARARAAAAPPAARVCVARMGLLLAALVDLAPIVTATLSGIAQDRIGGRDLLEALRDRGIADVDVGVQLLGEPAVGAFDFVVARPPGEAQYVVGIPHALARPSRPGPMTRRDSHHRSGIAGGEL